jgi:hypothetical protein
MYTCFNTLLHYRFNVLLENSGAFVPPDSMLTDELLLLKSMGNEIWKIQSTKDGSLKGRGTGLMNKTKKYIKAREKEDPSSLKNPCIYRYTYLDMAIDFQNKMHVLEQN